MFQFKCRFDWKHRYVINQGWRQTSKKWQEWKGSTFYKCSLGPPSSTSVQVRPEWSMIYTRNPDSQRLHCFTQCPLSVSGAVHASLWASWVTWINIWQGSPQVTSKLLLQQTYHISLQECSTAAETLLAAFIQRPCLNCFLFDMKENQPWMLWSPAPHLCVETFSRIKPGEEPVVVM